MTFSKEIDNVIACKSSKLILNFFFKIHHSWFLSQDYAYSSVHNVTHNYFFSKVMRTSGWNGNGNVNFHFRRTGTGTWKTKFYETFQPLLKNLSEKKFILRNIMRTTVESKDVQQTHSSWFIWWHKNVYLNQSLTE